MQIVQLLPAIAYGDAIGNDTLAIRDMILEMGFETHIYAEIIDNALPKGTAEPFSRFPDLHDDDIIIYHGSTGSELNFKLPELGGRKMMIYHNVTPPEFFRPYSREVENNVNYGLQGIQNLADKLDYCIADSEFNKNDLRCMGYTCPIDVCPILIPFSDYEKRPNQEILRTYRDDGYVNVLFVGRIAPNKKQENVIRAFYFYHKYFNPKSRLILAGSWGNMEKYRDRLRTYTRRLDLTQDVSFTGQIKFDEILAYYRIADVFLCMSEHEGFCVPLIEAMYFDVPVVACRSTAIPETLGGSGVLLEDGLPQNAAREIDRVVRSEPLRTEILEKQRARLADFSYEKVNLRLKTLLSGFLGGV